MLTLGETMVMFDPIADGCPERDAIFTLRIAGAESNFAIALTRLGVRCAWFSRVGSDPFGDVIVSTLSGEGVDVDAVLRDSAAPTGVFFKWRDGGRSHVHYYRTGSAASHLSAEDVPDEALDGVDLVHLTGITMALGPKPRELVTRVAQQAHERGITVVFDPNWRPALWRTAADAHTAQAEVLPFVDWYLCGEDEGRELFGADDVDGVVEFARAVGVRDVIVRVGERGAWVDSELVPPEQVATVVDETGAGDGFAAGFVFGLLHGWPPRRCVRLANLVAASALGSTGDWEAYPSGPDGIAALGRDDRDGPEMQTVESGAEHGPSTAPTG